MLTCVDNQRQDQGDGRFPLIPQRVKGDSESSWWLKCPCVYPHVVLAAAMAVLLSWAQDSDSAALW